MIIKPRIRGFVCTTAHPAGCRHNVTEQTGYAAANGLPGGPKKVLVIGASTGYGLAARIASAFGSGADTLGVFYERAPGENKTASAGWYNTASFEELAAAKGLRAFSINGDAFSREIKEQTFACMRERFGKADLVVYSLASPRRTDPDTGTTYSSVLKPIGAPFCERSVDIDSASMTEVCVPPATQEEIDATVKVMGGEDWALWIQALLEAGLLERGVKTVAFSYIGPELTHAVYLNGTIGRAKDHLLDTSRNITESLRGIGGEAFVSVNKALVTQASSAIPVVPLYISILYKVMKEKGVHEGTIEQCCRLLHRLYGGVTETDESGRIRLDDLEMREDVQAEVRALWGKVNNDNIGELTDIEGYRAEFYQLFGFGPFTDTDAETDPMVKIPSIG